MGNRFRQAVSFPVSVGPVFQGAEENTERLGAKCFPGGCGRIAENDNGERIAILRASFSRKASIAPGRPVIVPVTVTEIVCRCPLSRTVSRHTAAVNGRCLHPRFPAPASRFPAFGVASRPRSVHFPEGRQDLNR